MIPQFTMQLDIEELEMNNLENGNLENVNLENVNLENGPNLILKQNILSKMDDERPEPNENYQKKGWTQKTIEITT